MSKARRRREHRKKVNVNPKRARRKEERRKRPTVSSEQLKAAWNEEKTTRRNIEGAGLLFDVNKLNTEQENRRVKKQEANVVDLIEAEANGPRRDRRFVMKDDLKFLAQMISKHGLDEWETMARDPDNVYQLTSKQIERIYARCQKVPVAYNALMMACGLKETPMEYDDDNN